MLSLQLLILVVPILVIPSARGSLTDIEDLHKKKPYKFDYLMLTRIYPTAVCRADDDASSGSCVIPQESTMWTIHGLWPNFFNGSYPEFCDGTPEKFNSSMVDSIREQLKIYWPNLYPKHSQSSLWKHEWEKHGVCAESLLLMCSELRYFNTTLQIHKLYDIPTALNSQNLRPRLKPYTKEQAFNHGLANGHQAQFNCLKDKKTKQFLLADVRICLDKGFQIIKCPKNAMSEPLQHGRNDWVPPIVPLPSFQPCPKEIVYLPISLVSKTKEDIPYSRAPVSTLAREVINVWRSLFNSISLF